MNNEETQGILVADAFAVVRQYATMWNEKSMMDDMALRAAQEITDIEPGHMHIYFIVEGKELAETTSNNETLYAEGLDEAIPMGKAFANIHKKNVTLFEDNTNIPLEIIAPTNVAEAKE